MIDAGRMIVKTMLKGAHWMGLSRAYRSFGTCAGAILMLHRVTRHGGSPLGYNDHLTITPEFLDQALTELKRDGYQFMTMDEIADGLSNGIVTGCAAALTADDGYRDNLTEALPVLESHNIPITIYVAPGQIDGGVCLWWVVLETIIARSKTLDLPATGGVLTLDCSTPAARRKAFQTAIRVLTQEVAEKEVDGLMRGLAAQVGLDAGAVSSGLLMTWDELRQISANSLVTIGSHTVHHYHLRRLNDADAALEIGDAAAMIERQLGTQPRHMAFPYGYEAAVGPREPKLAEDAGFVTAVTTRHGLLTSKHDCHMLALPRISVNGHYQSTDYLSTMLSGITVPLANRGRRVVTV